MTFVNSEFTFLFYIKNNQNNFILSNKPLLIINASENYSLNHLRDIDFQAIVEEGEEIDLGIIRIPKKGGANIYSKILSTKNIHHEHVHILFSIKYKVHINNKKTFLQESTRGDDTFDVNHNNNYKMNLTYIQYKDMDVKVKNKKKNNNQKEEFILCIPCCFIHENFTNEFKKLI